MPEDLESIPDFAQAVKARFPQYADWDDYELAGAVLAKHPQYRSRVAASSGPAVELPGPVAPEAASAASRGMAQAFLPPFIKAAQLGAKGLGGALKVAEAIPTGLGPIRRGLDSAIETMAGDVSAIPPAAFVPEPLRRAWGQAPAPAREAASFLPQVRQEDVAAAAGAAALGLQAGKDVVLPALAGAAGGPALATSAMLPANLAEAIEYHLAGKAIEAGAHGLRAGAKALGEELATSPAIEKAIPTFLKFGLGHDVAPGVAKRAANLAAAEAEGKSAEQAWGRLRGAEAAQARDTAAREAAATEAAAREAGTARQASAEEAQALDSEWEALRQRWAQVQAQDTAAREIPAPKPSGEDILRLERGAADIQERQAAVRGAVALPEEIQAATEALRRRAAEREAAMSPEEIILRARRAEIEAATGEAAGPPAPISQAARGPLSPAASASMPAAEAPAPTPQKPGRQDTRPPFPGLPPKTTAPTEPAIGTPVESIAQEALSRKGYVGEAAAERPVHLMAQPLGNRVQEEARTLRGQLKGKKSLVGEYEAEKKKAPAWKPGGHVRGILDSGGIDVSKSGDYGKDVLADSDFKSIPGLISKKPGKGQSFSKFAESFHEEGKLEQYDEGTLFEAIKREIAEQKSKGRGYWLTPESEPDLRISDIASLNIPKGEIMRALDKIDRDRGVDKGVTVKRIKEVILRHMGDQAEQTFSNYHQMLSDAELTGSASADQLAFWRKSLIRAIRDYAQSTGRPGTSYKAGEALRMMEGKAGGQALPAQGPRMPQEPTPGAAGGVGLREPQKPVPEAPGKPLPPQKAVSEPPLVNEAPLAEGEELPPGAEAFDMAQLEALPDEPRPGQSGAVRVPFGPGATPQPPGPPAAITQPATAKLDAAIGEPPGDNRTIGQKVRDFVAAAHRKLVDFRGPLMSLEKKAGITGRHDASVVDAIQRYLGSAPGRIEHDTMRAVEMLEPLERKGLMADFRRYLQVMQNQKRRRDMASLFQKLSLAGRDAEAQRVLDKLSQNKVNPLEMTGAEDASAMAEMQRRLTPQQFQAVRGMARRWWGFVREDLHELRKVGAISDAGYQELISRGEDYVPYRFIRQMEYAQETGEARIPLRGENFSVGEQDLIHELQGGTGKIRNPIASSLEWKARAKRVIERQKVAMKMAEVSRMPGMAGLVDQVPPGHQPPPGFGKIYYLEDGKPKALMVSADVAEAFKGMDGVQAGAFKKFMEYFSGKNIAQVTATQANLEWGPFNFLKDNAIALALSPQGIRMGPVDLARLPLDLLSGFFDAAGKSAAWREALQAGALNTWQRHVNPEIILEGLKRKAILAGPPVEVGKQVLAGIAKPIEWASKVNNVLEEATKMAYYRRGKRAGLSPDEVVYNVRNYGGSPDFALGGSWTPEANMMALFFNAGVQDKARIARAIKEDPTGLAMSWGAVVGLPAIAGWAWNHQEKYRKDYEALKAASPYEIQNYHVMFTDGTHKTADGKEARNYYKFPKNHLEQITEPLLTGLLDALAERNPDNLTAALLDVFGNILPGNFNLRPGRVVEGLAKGAVSSLTPTLKVGVEELANRKMFQDQPIVPLGQEKLSPEKQYGPQTPEVIRKAGEVLGQSPARIHHVAEAYGTGLAGQAAWAADKAIGKPKDRPTAEGWESTAKLPFARRVMGSARMESPENIRELELAREEETKRADAMVDVRRAFERTVRSPGQEASAAFREALGRLSPAQVAAFKGWAEKRLREEGQTSTERQLRRMPKEIRAAVMRRMSEEEP